MFVRALPVVCSVLGLGALAACGGGDSKPIDAPQQNPTVLAVACPATPAATFSEDDAVFAFNPVSATINQGQVVKFHTTLTHDVEPAATMSDPGIAVGFNMDKCLMFTQSGTFKFKCGPHAFTGTIVVQ
jgi:plastocyanin